MAYTKKKKSEFTINEKQDAIRDSLRRMSPVHTHWQMLESLYRTGAQRELTQLDLNRILPFPIPGAFLRTVNMLLPHLTLVINSVAARDPKFLVTPVDGNPAVVERNGMIARAVLDYFWKRADATAVLRDMTQDMVVIGNAFCKVGWAYTAETRDRTEEEVGVDAAEVMVAAQEMGEMLDYDMVEEMLENVSLTEQRVEEDEPYVEYVSPYDVFVPADARRINSARWIAVRVRLPKDEVANNDLFDKKAREELVTDSSYADPATISQFEMQDQGLPDAFSYVTIYEFYDMRARTMCVMQLDSDRYLYHGEIPYAHRYPPVVHMRNFSDGGSTFWGFGDVENVAGIQLMVNEIMTAEINDLKRVGNKYFINKKVLTPELAKSLQESKPDQVIPVDLPPNIPMSEVLQPVQRLATPADNYMMEDKLQNYVMQILGISDLQAGSISSASRVPAAAVQSQMGAQTTRAMEKTVNVERASREIATRMLALCQQFLDDARAVRIAGPDAPTWLQVSADDIDGEFSVDTESGSTQSINPAQRAAQGLDILNNIVPALANFGYDPHNAIRMAITYLGLNPDHLLIRPEPQPAPPAPQPAGLEAGMGAVPPAAAAGLPDIAGMMGGAGVPSAPPATPELPDEIKQMIDTAMAGPAGADALPDEIKAMLDNPDLAPELTDVLLGETDMTDDEFLASLDPSQLGL